LSQPHAPLAASPLLLASKALDAEDVVNGQLSVQCNNVQICPLHTSRSLVNSVLVLMHVFNGICGLSQVLPRRLSCGSLQNKHADLRLCAGGVQVTDRHFQIQHVQLDPVRRHGGTNQLQVLFPRLSADACLLQLACCIGRCCCRCMPTTACNCVAVVASALCGLA